MPHAEPPTIARRFRDRARLITVGAIVLGVVVVAGGGIAVAIPGGVREGGVPAYLVAVVTVVVGLVGPALFTAPRARALRLLRERHPDQVVVLARRLPPVVSDMPQYLANRGLDVDIDDRWYPITVSHEGIGVWTAQRDPQLQFVMPWEELGEIVAERTSPSGGDAHWTVTIDVKPYVVPLTADVGYAWGIVTMAMDGTDVAGVVDAVNALRPATAAD